MRVWHGRAIAALPCHSSDDDHVQPKVRFAARSFDGQTGAVGGLQDVQAQPLQDVEGRVSELGTSEPTPPPTLADVRVFAVDHEVPHATLVGDLCHPDLTPDFLACRPV